MSHATGSSSLTLTDVIRRAQYPYPRSCADIVKDAAVFLDAYKAKPDGYLREWLKARWTDLRSLDGHRIAYDTATKYFYEIPEYKELGRYASITLVKERIEAEKQQAAYYMSEYERATQGAWRHAILSLAAQRAQHCQESLLSILEKSDTKKIKDKTVGELKDCLKEARDHEQKEFQEANDKTYRDISNPPPALPHPETGLDNFSDTFSQMGLTDPRPQSRNSRRSQHGQGATEEPETHRAGGVHFTSPQWSISKTCFHPVSRRSYGTL
ncbi:hypothetical protein JCM5353_004050 [Sporobolomyces roseus]